MPKSDTARRAVAERNPLAESSRAVVETPEPKVERYQGPDLAEGNRASTEGRSSATRKAGRNRTNPFVECAQKVGLPCVPPKVVQRAARVCVCALRGCALPCEARTPSTKRRPRARLDPGPPQRRPHAFAQRHFETLKAVSPAAGVPRGRPTNFRRAPTTLFQAHR